LAKAGSPTSKGSPVFNQYRLFEDSDYARLALFLRALGFALAFFALLFRDFGALLVPAVKSLSGAILKGLIASETLHSRGAHGIMFL
jgi:hypothetical protein